MRTGIIYCYRYKATGQFYIGKTIDPKRRAKEHFTGRTTHKLGRYIMKYGYDSFVYEVLMDGVPENELNDWESFFIWQYRSWAGVNRNGFNMTTGGDGMSPESARLFSKEPEYRAKKAGIMNRLYQDPNFHERVRQANRKLHESPEFKEKHRNAMRDMVESGRWGEVIARRSKLEGWKENTIAAGRKMAIPVVCIETGIIYISCRNAGKQTGFNHSNINLSCRNPKRGTGGCHWRYATPEEVKILSQSTGAESVKLSPKD